VLELIAVDAAVLAAVVGPLPVVAGPDDEDADDPTPVVFVEPGPTVLVGPAPPVLGAPPEPKSKLS
jgi:hypothetical protein